MTDNKKKRVYESPKCVDLGAASRSVTGQDRMMGCFPGSSAGPDPEQCASGGDGWTGTYCSSGGRPGSGDCVSGNNPFYCEAGSGGDNDPDGCRSGMYVT